jgi:DNA repair protein RecN (Recombination protein N)
MLTNIQIRNLATIHEINLDFKSGTTVITGETGVGKSILIDAIELALGQRAVSEMVRQGQEKAELSLCFDVSKLPQASTWLKNYDLDSDTNECIIRRSIHKDGRSRCYINGMPTTLQPLRELSELLINIHGQHEHQTLLKSEVQRQLLDQFAGHAILMDNVRVLAEEWRALSKEIFELQHLSNEHKQRGELLKFQLTELEELNLTPEEFQQLDLEHKQLAHSDELLKSFTLALNNISENDNNNALHLLNHALQALEMVQQVDPKISVWADSLKNAILLISDTEEELHRYLNHVDLDPDRLYKVENRISTLFDLARKHKVAPQDLFELQKKLAAEYSKLENSDERLVELRQQLDALEKHYHEVAHKLSQSRLKAAKKLADEITETIHELAMPHAEFHVLFEMEDFSHPSPLGMERVIFEIKTNPGQPLQPLAKIASGGELSRISLAIHLATAGQHAIPTLIFDEVDVGIGGATAEIVGKQLRKLGNTHQVVCITHAPQVAAQSHQHLCVEKYMERELTYTRIRSLTLAEKIQELARMLGGVEITQKTLEHAREMVEKIDDVSMELHIAR